MNMRNESIDMTVLNRSLSASINWIVYSF